MPPLNVNQQLWMIFQEQELHLSATPRGQVVIVSSGIGRETLGPPSL